MLQFCAVSLTTEFEGTHKTRVRGSFFTLFVAQSWNRAGLREQGPRLPTKPFQFYFLLMIGAYKTTT